jgi:hypothetical protein
MSTRQEKDAAEPPLRSRMRILTSAEQCLRRRIRFGRGPCFSLTHSVDKITVNDVIPVANTFTVTVTAAASATGEVL